MIAFGKVCQKENKKIVSRENGYLLEKKHLVYNNISKLSFESHISILVQVV